MDAPRRSISNGLCILLLHPCHMERDLNVAGQKAQGASRTWSRYKVLYPQRRLSITTTDQWPQKSSTSQAWTRSSHKTCASAQMGYRMESGYCTVSRQLLDSVRIRVSVNLGAKRIQWTRRRNFSGLWDAGVIAMDIPSLQGCYGR